MKTSNKILTPLALLMFLGIALLMVVTRMFLGYEPDNNASKAPASIPALAVDSSQAVSPAGNVRWHRVTLGLRKSMWRGVIEDNSIFKDLDLTYVNSSCWIRPLFRPFNESRTYSFGLQYRRILPDTVRLETSDGYVNDNIYIQFHKYNKNQTSHETDLYKKVQLKAVESPHGVWNYWSFDAACCEWKKGRWYTHIDVQLGSCGRDSAKAVELRDKIRDRLFAYYKTLK
jgi:hypothetical protein